MRLTGVMETQANAESLDKNITSVCGFYRGDHALASSYWWQ
jgi:hypothetical protein